MPAGFAPCSLRCTGQEVTPTVASSPAPSETPLPGGTTPSPLPSATPSATATPVLGTTQVLVYVRSGPGTSYSSLGLIYPGKQVQILSQEADGKWFIILYPGGPGGQGWVSSAYIKTTPPADIPTVTPNYTPTASGPVGLVMQKLNVRSGPGTSFGSLGVLPAQSVVVLTGKDTTASWLQIEYASAPGGHGWVNAGFIQAADTSGLPVLDAYGNRVVSTLAITVGPFVTLTPTPGLALDDHDSAGQPAYQVTFSPSGIRQFSYSGQVSAPQGDSEDWIGFTPYAASGISASLTVSLNCSGNGSIAVELIQDGVPLSSWGTLQCGDANKVITLAAEVNYEFHLSAVPNGSEQSLVAYTLKVRNGQ